MNRPRLIAFQLLGLLLMTGLLQACGPFGEGAGKLKSSPVSISGYNYTIEGIQEFYVNGQWGGNVSIGAGGGSNVCCVNLPKKWQPGLSAEVTWRRSDCGGSGPGNERCPIGKRPWAPAKTLKATVPIDFYDSPDGMYVAFLPNDEVKIFVSRMGLSNPNHPAKLGRARPLDHPEWKRDE